MFRLVTDYLENSAQTNPNKIAFDDTKKKMSFKECQQAAHRIATFLIEMGNFKSPVVVFLDKSVECMPSFMGVAYSGNFYIPIDVKMPHLRIKKILSVLAPRAIITDFEHLDIVANFSDKIPIFLYENMMQHTINEELLYQTQKRIIDTDILYVLFTSGSTGEPKGVIISHKSVIDYTEWVTETFHIDSSHIFANQAPFYFDNSILDIYQTLKNAATMYIVPEMFFSFPLKLLEFLQQKKVNILFWVPSALSALTHRGALTKCYLPDLRKVLFCGEVMPNKSLNVWRSLYSQILFANLYGPTEITDVCTYYIVNRDFRDDEPLPIGIACKNTEVFLLNEHDELASDGEIGEICVRGTSLSYGYYNNPQKTQEAFVQNPLNRNYPEIIYRTGDLARYNQHRELIYISRKDYQIKHMGHRIELGEIEVVANAKPDIKQVCCLYDDGKKEIVLFYTADTYLEDIEEYLSKFLSHYMLPSRYICLDTMPLNRNGKIDRTELKHKLLGQ